VPIFNGRGAQAYDFVRFGCPGLSAAALNVYRFAVTDHFGLRSRASLIAAFPLCFSAERSILISI
jgi:hypothetical protein